jgi:hypothetical protein
MPWDTVLSLTNGTSIRWGNTLATLPTLAKEWRLSFELQPTGYAITGNGFLAGLTTGESP